MTPLQERLRAEAEGLRADRPGLNRQAAAALLVEAADALQRQQNTLTPFVQHGKEYGYFEGEYEDDPDDDYVAISVSLGELRAALRETT